jgi:hypothetical protein
MLARDTEGLFGWAVAAFFIPALALALGVCTESRKPFEAVYTAWWYIGPLHQMRKLDFIGTQPASSTPVLYLAASMALLLGGLFLAESAAVLRVSRDPFEPYHTRQKANFRKRLTPPFDSRSCSPFAGVRCDPPRIR